MARDTGSASTAAGEVTVTRMFQAPRERVWKAWTEATQFAQWFGTPPFRTPPSRVNLDVRPGGQWRATQVSETDGTELPFFGVYREVVEPERLVFTFEDPQDPDGHDIEVATVTLRQRVERGTEMTLRQEGHLPQEQYGLLAEGYNRFFDRMRDLVEGGGG